MHGDTFNSNKPVPIFWESGGALKAGILTMSFSGIAVYYHNGQASNLATDVVIDASMYNQLYGNSNTVQPASLNCQYLIKY